MKKTASVSPFQQKMSDLFEYLERVDLKSSLKDGNKKNESRVTNNVEANRDEVSRPASQQETDTERGADSSSSRNHQRSLNAEEEKEKAREWAKQMRSAVTKWLEQDQRVSKQHRAETEAAVSSYKNAIAHLEIKLKTLEIKSQGQLERYLSGEEKMHSIILNQQEQIVRLEKKLNEGQTSIPENPDTNSCSNNTPLEAVGPEGSVATTSPLMASSPSNSSHHIENPPSATSEIIRNQRKRIKELEQEILVTQKSIIPKKQIRFADQVMIAQETNEATPPQKSKADDQQVPIDQKSKVVHTPFPTNHIGPTSFPTKAFDTPGGSVAISPDDSFDSRDHISDEAESCSDLDTRPRKNDRLNAIEETKRSIQFEETPSDSTTPTPRPRRVRMESPQGNKIIRYGNGAIKEIRPDGVTIVTFTNGDVQTKRHGLESYFYSATGVLSILQPDGSTIWEFPSGQVERHWKDGRREVIEYGRASPESGYISVSDVPPDQLIVE